MSFETTMMAIDGHTLIDPVRMGSLWDLVGQTARTAGCILEVGVWMGGSGALIAHRAHELGIEEAVFLCDTFTGVVKADSALDGEYVGGEWAVPIDSVLALTKELPHVKVLPGVFPDETGVQIESHTFRFCHIDVDTHNSARDAFEWIWPRLSVGGIVVFDDYGAGSTPGVRVYVDRKLQDFHDAVLVVGAEGTGIVVKMAS